MAKTIPVKTRLDKNSPQVETLLTLDMSNLTSEDRDAYAEDAIIVKWQGGIRRVKGNDRKVPATATYVVPKPGTRAAADPQAAARSMPLEQLEAIYKERITILRKAEGK